VIIGTAATPGEIGIQ